MDLFILLGTLFLCFAIGMPISYSLGIGALAGALWIGIPPEAVMLKISDGVSKVAMLTIPFFVLAGAIMAEGGMARRLVAFANVIVGVVRVRGGLAVVNIVATTFLSGISGSSIADTSAIGSVMIPQMEKVGYPRVFATNVTISGSLQAILVPPSHNAVIYSLATGGTISIISLFMAGVVPGLLLGFALIMLCLFIAYRDGHPTGEAVPFRDAVRISIDAAWGLITIVIIIGGILLGIFTAIEAGAVACIWAFFVTMFIYRDYRWRDLPALVHRTLKTVAMVMTLIAMASSFGYVMALMQMPAKITAFFLSVSENKYVILMLINFMLLVLGCLMDMAPLILICTPILLPVVMKLGVDPVHFGMIMLLNLGIGLLTPPVGSTLFVGCAVGNVKLEDVMRGSGRSTA
jgi:tripartite ATP-independent transporter DctM subunit